MEKDWKKMISIGLILVLLLEMMSFNDGTLLPYISYGKERVGTNSDAGYDKRIEKEREDEKITEDYEMLKTHADVIEEFEVTESGKLIKYNGDGGNIVLPKEVKYIDEKIFQGREDLESVTILGEIAYIDRHAFENCTNLKSITMDSKGLTYIGVNAFKNCINLSDVSFLDNVINIDVNAFEGCSSINSVQLLNCSKVGRGAFENCTQLKSVFVGSQINEINIEAFMDCINLEEVILPQNAKYFVLKDSIFKNCISLKNITIPNTISEIESGAFENCKNFKSIRIPDNVKIIRSSAFANCDNLTYVSLPKQMDILEGAFNGCRSLRTITLPNGISNISDWCFANCRSLESIVIPENIRKIGDFAFCGCTKLSDIALPKEMESIGDCAFSETSIKSINIPKGIKIIKGFSGCVNLENVVIQEGAVEIGMRAFEKCTNLRNIEIPYGVKTIGVDAFARCKNLQVAIPDSVIQIQSLAFFQSENITLYSFSNRYIEEYAKNHNISYVTLGDDTKKRNVFILTKWDTEQNTPHFTELSGIIVMENYHVTSETDMSFVNSIDTLIGNPVLVQTDTDNNILSIKPAKKKIGTITAISTMSVTIDGTWYATSVTSNWMNLLMYIGKTCLAYVCEDQVGSLVIAEEKTGRLDGLNTGENKIIIDNISYPMDLKDLSFLASIDLWLGKTIKFEIFDGVVYRIVTEDYETQYCKKVKSFDSATNTIYFEDGSLHVITDSSKFSPEQFVGKWVVYTLKTSIANGVEITEIQELKPTVSVQLTLDDTRTILCKNNQYAFDGGSYENSSSFKIPFTVIISNSVKGVDKNILSTINDEQMNIVVNQLSIKQPDGFNFDWSGSGQVSLPDSLKLKIGESWMGNGFLRPEIFWVPEQEMTVTLECTAKVNNQDFHSNAEFTIKNLDKNPVYSKTTIDAVEEYVKKCVVQDIIKIPMGGLLTESQRQQLNKVLSVWLTIINDQNINDAVKRSLFESYTKNDANSVTSSIIVPVHINNLQYGNLGVRNIRFTARLNDFGSPLSSMLHEFNIENMPELSAELNSIQWKIIDTQGLPQMLTSGYIQVEANADLDALEDTLNKAVEKAKKDFQEAVKNAYKEVDLLNMLKEELIGQAVNGLVGENLNPQMTISPYVASVIKETFSGIIWQNEINIKGTVESTSKEILKRASKKIFIKCPVDVYLYYNDKLKGVIKNNQIDENYAKLNVGSYMEIKGEDEKIIYLPDDSFSIKLVGTDSGSMDYIIEEYDGDNSEAKLLRTLYFDNLPLETGKIYTGNLEEGVQKDKKVYALQSDGKTVEADYDTMLGDKIEDKPALDNNGNGDNNNSNNNGDNSNSNTGGHTGGRGGSGGGSGRTSSGNTGTWEKDSVGWWYKRKDGSWPVNTWCQIFYNGANEWYYFNEHGYMVTGWMMDNGRWYYLNPISDGTQGKMLLGWQYIDGKWYYLNEISDGTKGALFVNTWVGEYYVNQNGVWVS